MAAGKMLWVEKRLEPRKARIGPAYEDKVGRRGIRMSEFVDSDALKARLEMCLPEKNRILRMVVIQR